MPSQVSQATQSILRDPSMFQWYVIPLLAITVYVYAVEVEKRNWNVVLAGLAFWGMDWFNEIVNGLYFHFNNFAPFWGVAKPSAFVILIGLNIEICFMFAIAGITFCKVLPADKKLKILGIPNRIFIACAGSAFCVFVEILLNRAGALIWEHSWWSAHSPLPIFLFGYLTFFIAAFLVYDMQKMKNKLLTVSGIYIFDVAALVLFAGVYKWI